MIDLATLPYQKHSQTSKDAAKRERKRQYAFKWELLYCFNDGCNWTDEQLIQVWWSKQPSTVRARRIQLCHEGYLKDSGQTRLTKSGNKATVWVRTDKQIPSSSSPVEGK